jgi:hypothetical protein
MKWLAAFSCYADAILVKPKRRLDINAKGKAHLGYDTKYNTATPAARTATPAARTATPAARTATPAARTATPAARVA